MIKRRLQILDENEPPNLNNFRHHDSKSRDDELQSLNKKLESILNGLEDIETERQSLTETNVRLKKDNAKLHAELSLREQEITTLTKRCSSQTEKMKESTLLRSAKISLLKQVETLTAELAEHKSSQDRADNIQTELKESRKTNNELTESLKEAKIENQKALDSLNHSLQSVGRLTEEKQSWEEERRRLNQRMELEVSKQKLQHEQDLIQFKEDLRAKDVRIEHLAQEVQAKLRLVASLRSDVSNLRKTSQEDTLAATRTHNQKVTNLTLNHAAALEQMKLDNEKTISQLQDELSEKNSALRLLRKEMSSQMEETMQLSSALEKLNDDRDLANTLAADVEALEGEVSELREGTLERDTAIAELEAEILKLEIEKELLLQSNKKAVSHAQELQSCQVDLKSTINELRGELALTKESLKDAHAHSTKDRLEAEERLKAHETHSEETISRLRCQLNSLNHELNAQVRQLADDVETKDETVETLRRDLRQLGDELLETTQEHSKESKALRQELQNLKTELALKNDEIRDIRIIEMHEQEEVILTLRKDVVRLTKVIQEKDEVLQSGTVELTESLARQQRRCAEMETRLADKGREHQLVVESLEGTKNDLERRIDQQEATIKGLGRKVNELTSQIQRLEGATESANTALGECRKKCQILRESVKSTETERDNFILALERQSDRANKLEILNKELERECTNWETNASGSSQAVISQKEQIASLQEDLRDRSRILSDVIARNKAMEERLASENSSYLALEEESNELLRQLTEKDSDIRRREAVWTEREDKYIEDLHQEQNRREIAEADLKATRAKLDLIRQDNKDTSELEKENQALKDKVRRQETYLKRKLEKDRVLRDRSLPSKGMKTPARATRSSKIPTPHSATSRALSCRSIPEALDASLDMDLDDLLAD